MARRLPIVLLLAAFLIGTGGCSGPGPPNLRRNVPAEFPSHSVAEIRRSLARSADTLRAFSAEARLTLDTPQRSGTFSAEIRHRRNGPLYVSISPGLGIEAVRLLLTPDSFFVYDRINNRLTYGAIEDAAARLPAPLLLDRTFETLLGLLAPSASVDWQLSADSSYYRLRAPDGARAYTVDPAFWRVTRYADFAPAGTLVEERTFSAFDIFEGIYLPRRVALRRPSEEARVVLYYERLRLNPPDLSFDLDVADSAERIPIS